MHIGVAHHLGWAILVTATADHEVIDRRRVELIADDLPSAPIHHHSGVHPMHDTGDPFDDRRLADLAARVRAAAHDHAVAALDQLRAELPAPVASLSLRAWPADFDRHRHRCGVRRTKPGRLGDVPEVIAAIAGASGWVVHQFDAASIEDSAATVLGDPALLQRPRTLLGPPWNKDHRLAYASTVVAVAAARGSD
ncbi:MAG: hypothetical protein R2695_22320 [Acidimicrobiales bacterium]